MAKKKKTGGSLRDQFLQAGLISAKQARKAEKQTEQQMKKGPKADESKQEAAAALQKKREEDRQRNVQLNEQAQAKALLAQVKQLVGSNSKRQQGEVAYNFTDQNKIKKIYISEQNKTELNGGYLAIVKVDAQYDLVPEVVARKIEARHKESVLFLHDRSKTTVDEDDPYKDYPIPDDLDW